jgi:hypothetical protein
MMRAGYIAGAIAQYEACLLGFSNIDMDPNSQMNGPNQRGHGKPKSTA